MNESFGLTEQDSGSNPDWSTKYGNLFQGFPFLLLNFINIFLFLNINYMYRRIILCGPAASGKDYLRKKLESKNFKYAVSYTTRPSREGEAEGKDYFFISPETAQEMIQRGDFFEYVMFNGWLYGTTMKQWQQTDNEFVYIMTPTGISHINESDRKDCFIIYVDIDIETRRTRLQNRNMPGDTLERRIEADEADFNGFKNYDIRITNPDF